MKLNTDKLVFVKLILFLNKQKNNGYSLVEVIVITIIIGIMSVIVAPLFRPNDPTADSYAQLKSILQQTRTRAISTTTSIRIRPDPNQPDNKFMVERFATGNCDLFSRLTAEVNNSSQILPVTSTEGFQISNEISVGGDSSNNEIIGIDPTNLTITIGSPLGTTQSVDNPVQNLSNQLTEGTLEAKDLTLPTEAKFSANISDWTICFSGRGIAYIYDNNLSQQNSLQLTISNSINSNTELVTISKGGSIQ